MRSRNRPRWIDPFIGLLILTLALGLMIPMGEAGLTAVSWVGDVMVVLLFFTFGARLAGREILGTVRSFRTQGTVLASTYIVFPALGLGLEAMVSPFLGEAMARGLLFLTLLPATITSAAAYTAIAGGDVAGAVTASTLSNLIGMFITPFLVFMTMGGSGAFSGQGVSAILLQLLLPFILGNLARRWVKGWLRRFPVVVTAVERVTILVVVFGATATATVAGVWSQVSATEILAVIALCVALLLVMVCVSEMFGRVFRLERQKSITLLMCAPSKSLGAGLPMAQVLFDAPAAATVVLPIIVFHQLQLICSAILAKKLSPSRP